MFKHCINQIEEHILCNLLDTDRKFQFACMLFGSMCSTILHCYYNGIYNTFVQYTTPPYFGMFWMGKTPVWTMYIMVLIATMCGFLFGFWWGIVRNDVFHFGRKRWCTKNTVDLNINDVDFEQKKEN